MSRQPLGIYDRIYAIVSRIPAGRVTHYGAIARMLPRCTARMVGYALAALQDEQVPWWRVVNAQRRISLRTAGGHHYLQRQLLEAEGVRFDKKDRIEAHFMLYPASGNKTHRDIEDILTEE